MHRYAVAILILATLASCTSSAAQLSPSPTSDPSHPRSQDLRLVGESRLTEEAWTYFAWSRSSTNIALSRPIASGGTGADYDGPLAIVDVLTRAIRSLPQFGRSPVWQPDGQAILFLRDDQHSGENSAWLYHVATGELISLPTLPGHVRWFAAWNADGRVIYEAQDGTWSARLQGTAASGREWSDVQHLATFELGSDHWAAVAPVGDSLVTYDGSDLLSPVLWLVRPGRERVLFDRRRPVSIGNCCAWSQDGSYFAYFAPDLRFDSQELTVVNANGQGRRVVMVALRELGQGELMSLSTSADGQMIALAWSPAGDGFPSENNEIHTINLDGTGLRRLTSKGAGGYYAIQWSPNGRYIGFQRKGQVWVAEMGGLK